MNFETLRRIGEIEQKLEAQGQEIERLRLELTELKRLPDPNYGLIPPKRGPGRPRKNA